MLNLNELIDSLKVPGTVAKLQKLGDFLQYALPWAALSLVAFTGKADLAWLWLHGCVTSILLVSGLKFLSNYTRFGTRPNGGENSFPSGHTAGAFLGASFMGFAFGPTLLTIAFVALAALTGLSRVLSKNHWWRDVIGGAAIATACMYVFVGM